MELYKNELLTEIENIDEVWIKKHFSKQDRIEIKRLMSSTPPCPNGCIDCYEIEDCPCQSAEYILNELRGD